MINSARPQPGASKKGSRADKIGKIFLKNNQKIMENQEKIIRPCN